MYAVPVDCETNCKTRQLPQSWKELHIKVICIGCEVIELQENLEGGFGTESKTKERYCISVYCTNEVHCFQFKILSTTEFQLNKYNISS